MNGQSWQIAHKSSVELLSVSCHTVVRLVRSYSNSPCIIYFRPTVVSAFVTTTTTTVVVVVCSSSAVLSVSDYQCSGRRVGNCVVMLDTCRVGGPRLVEADDEQAQYEVNDSSIEATNVRRIPVTQNVTD